MYAPQERIILCLLLLTDLLFIFLFGLRGCGITLDDGFILTYDRSYGEVFQYIKFYWLVVLLLSLCLQKRSALYGALASIFMLLLIDDYAMLHETLGESIATKLAIPAMWMLQPYDFGELIIFAGYMTIIAALLFIGWLNAEAAQIRFLCEMVGLLGILAIFAVGVDLLHALALPELISNAIGALEDGGEMIVVSLLTWCTLRHAIKATSADSASYAI